jgi:hypothetical protein
MLVEMLSCCRSELRLDIAGTKAMELREALKQREAFLDKLLNQLQTGQAGIT